MLSQSQHFYARTTLKQKVNKYEIQKKPKINIIQQYSETTT